MADKAISELVAAEQITATDMFVLEQNNTAKKLTGQILLNWLTKAADGHGGISSIVKQSTSGLTDTYRITLADTTTFDFTVSNGKGISSIAKQSTSGLVDTYKISYNDGTSTTFPVTNGRGIKSWTESVSGLVHTYTITYNDGSTTTVKVTDGAKGDKGDNAYTWIKYASQKPTASSHNMSDIPDNWIGVYAGNSSTAPTDYTQYQWFQFKGEKGDTGNPAVLNSSKVEYQVSDSGTIIPSGVWSTSVPVVAQGKYLWTRTTQTYNTGDPVVSYSVGRMGLDGSGSVSSVADISPDSSGNVPLTAGDVGALADTGGDVAGEIRMNGQPISGLNPPTEDTQAANKGYVDKRMNEGAILVLKQLKQAAPVNLLDNANFRNPVNQRNAKGVYATWTYTIDRWKTYNVQTTIGLSANGLALSGCIYQIIPASTIEQYYGKTMTLAAKISGTIYCATGVVKKVDVYTQYIALDIPNGYLKLNCEDKTNAFFIINSTSGDTVEWAALYEGEYTADTLPEYHPKGYAVELAECQRYYVGTPTSNSNLSWAGYTFSETEARLTIPMGTMMQIAPTVTFTDIGALRIYSNGTAAMISNVIGAALTPNGVTLRLQSAGLTPNVACVLKVNSGFALSADL